MNNRTTLFVLGLLVLLVVGAGIAVYPQLPEKVASHWNAAGEVDGYMGKFWGIFMVPMIMLVLAILLYFIPKIDPLRSNVDQFRKYYNLLVVEIMVFMLAVFVLILSWNLGWQISFGRAMPVMMGLLFIGIGQILPKIKRNWFAGIRTPWSMSSDVVWEKTHLVGGKAFIASGVISCLGGFFPAVGIWFVLGSVIIAMVFTVGYSYVVYKSEVRS